MLFGVPEGANAIRRIEIALAGLIAVIGLGVLGYMLLGLTFLEALYQTVFTVATVGYTEVYERTRAAEIFTIVLILLGVGVVLYNLGVIVEGGPSTRCTGTSSCVGTAGSARRPSGISWTPVTRRWRSSMIQPA